MIEYIKNIFQNAYDYLGNTPGYLLAAILVIIFFSDIMGMIRMVIMVIKIYCNKNKNLIVSHINFLLDTKGEFIQQVADFTYIENWHEKQVIEIIKNYTAAESNTYGVVEKRSAKYYTDLQKACITDKGQLDVLAFSIALKIVNEIGIYRNKKSYVIAGQSEGNIILANRVANILGLRFIIIGKLGGKKEHIFGKIKKLDEVILVDDILFTGAMLERNLYLLNKNGFKCYNIIVILRRGLFYQEKLSRVNNRVGYNAEVRSVVDFLDDDFDKLI